MVAPYVPISDIVPWTQAIAGLNQFVYSTNWTAYNASDILVYSRLPNIPTSDVLQLVDSSHYTVQFIGSESTVQVTFLALLNPVQYSIVTIMRDTPSQFLNLYTNTNFLPSMLNSDFENLVQVDQQNQLYWQQIVPRYNNSATVNVPIDTILPILKAGQFWAKNSSNTAIVATDISSEGGSGAPTNAPYVTYFADSTLSESFNLGALDSGLLAQTSALGISTPYVLNIPLEVPYGGTGLETITPFAVLVGGASSTLPITPISDIGDNGDVLTSSGPGFPPSWQPAPSIVDVVPIGTIIDFAGTSAPTNYLVCDGTSYATASYPSLFSVIGYTWGGSSSDFNVPDLQGYVTAGAGGSLPPLSDTVGSVGGDVSVILDSTQMPSGTPTNASGSGNITVASGAVTYNIPANNAGVYGTGVGAAVTIVQPTAIVLKCIKYQ